MGTASTMQIMAEALGLMLPGTALMPSTAPELKEAMSVPPDEGCRLLETMVAEKALPAQDNYTGVLIAYQFKQTGERGL